MAESRRRCIEEARAHVLAAGQPHVFVVLRSSPEGCYAKATIEGVGDGPPRTFVGVLYSREEAVSTLTSWALGWLRKLREGAQMTGSP